MTQDVRVWRIGDQDTLDEIRRSKLDLESRLEDWLAADISTLDEDLLVIGRQVETDFGGVIDLLCMNGAADLVVVELKRDKTPRQIVAQTLDYASWVDGLSHERIGRIGAEYLNRELGKAFLETFGHDLPESINTDHRLVVVASQIDPSSERIIEYLSTRHGVSINAATFQYFREPDNRELLTRVFLLEPEEVDYRARTKADSKRAPKLTYEQLEELAEATGVGELYSYALDRLSPLFDGTRTTQSSVSMTASVYGKRNAVLNLIPSENGSEDGLAFQIYSFRVRDHFGVEPTSLREALPEGTKEWEYYGNAPEKWRGYEGRFRSREELDRLFDALAGGSALDGM